jgi:hypothetical protein
MRSVLSQLKCGVFVVCLFVSVHLLAKGFPTFPSYRMPDPVVAGDFNGDGKVDLLSFAPCSGDSCSTSTITVALGKGTSGFGAPISSSTANLVLGPAVVGDFNGDHKLDVAFLSYTPGAGPFTPFVSIALGNGDGTFGPVLNLTAATFTQSLMVGDVNNDGKLDLIVVVDLNPGTTQVYLGNGNGTFQAPNSSVPGLPCQLADINGDGNLDLVGNGIFLGNGDGTFQSQIALPGPGGCPAIADFNGDGKLDVAFLNGNAVTVFFGNGNATFQSGVTYKAGESAVELLVADFNGDGKPDLFLSDGTILLNTGNGTFRPSVRYGFGQVSLVADVNRDGRSDVIFGVVRGAGISVALARSDGTFAASHVYSEPLDQSFQASMTVGDFNGDGKLDLAVCGTFTNGIAGELVRFIGEGDGTFGSAMTKPTGSNHSLFIAASDLNHDGNLDVVTASDDSINVLLGLGGLKLKAPTSYSATSTTVLVVADFNGDGIPDIAANGSPGQVLLGNGDGTFRSGLSLPAGIQTLLAGDFNNDNKLDLVILSSNGIGIMLGNGDGTFQPALFYQARPGGKLVTADFNNDGKLDLAEVSPAPTGMVARIFLGNGDGTLGTAMSTGVNLSQADDPNDVVAADFDADGNVDLAITIQTGGVAILSGKGSGRFRAASLYFTQGSFGLHALLAADFDRNGTQDLAILDPLVGTITVLLNEP